MGCDVALLFVAEAKWGAPENLNRKEAPERLWEEPAIKLFQKIFELSPPKVQPK